MHKIDEISLFLSERHQDIVLQQGRHSLVSEWRFSSVNLKCAKGLSHFDDTSTLTGFVKLALCNLATFVVIVAEYR